MQSPTEDVLDSFDSNLPVCYEILLYLASRMGKLEPGETLEFVTSDPTAADSIPEWTELRGYTLQTAETLDDQRLRFVLQK
jgi:TusA-related sulfurtransferase